MGTSSVPPTPVEQTKELMQQPGGRSSVKELLSSKQFHDQVAMALPRHMKPERFIRVALNATLRQPELIQCQRESLFLALLQLSAYGIEADGRRAHLIPFWDYKTCTCGHPIDFHKQGKCQQRNCTCNVAQKRRLVQLIIDYKGLAELVRRSGDVSYIHSDMVLEGDDWDFQFGSEAFLRHKPNLEMGTYKERKIKAFYSFVKLKDGTEDFIVMSKADVDAIRERSKSKDSGPWVSDYPEMGKKTVFKRHSKWLPLSPEVQDAVHTDDESDDFSANAGLVLDGITSVPVDDEPEPQAETLADRVAKAAASQQQTQAEPASEPKQSDLPADAKPEPTSGLPDWASVTTKDEWPDDPFAPALGRRIIVDGKRFQRSSPTEDNWKDVSNAKRGKGE